MSMEKICIGKRGLHEEMDVPEKSVNKTKALEFYLNKFYNE